MITLIAAPVRYWPTFTGRYYLSLIDSCNSVSIMRCEHPWNASDINNRERSRYGYIR
jgi:hypothetical protein